jgi:hypothetical protein
MDAPETRYVTVGDADVAYQVLGEGGVDLLYCYGLGSHLEMFWEDLVLRLHQFKHVVRQLVGEVGAEENQPPSTTMSVPVMYDDSSLVPEQSGDAWRRPSDDESDRAVGRSRRRRRSALLSEARAADLGRFRQILSGRPRETPQD